MPGSCWPLLLVLVLLLLPLLLLWLAPLVLPLLPLSPLLLASCLDPSSTSPINCNGPER
jgi:hypothetical protein